LDRGFQDLEIGRRVGARGRAGRGLRCRSDAADSAQRLAEVESLVRYYGNAKRKGLAERLRLMQDESNWTDSDKVLWTGRSRETFEEAKKNGFVRSGAGQLGRGGRGRTGWKGAEQIGDAFLPTAEARFLCVDRTQVAPGGGRVLCVDRTHSGPAEAVSLCRSDAPCPGGRGPRGTHLSVRERFVLRVRRGYALRQLLPGSPLQAGRGKAGRNEEGRGRTPPQRRNRCGQAGRGEASGAAQKRTKLEGLGGSGPRGPRRRQTRRPDGGQAAGHDRIPTTSCRRTPKMVSSGPPPS